MPIPLRSTPRQRVLALFATVAILLAACARPPPEEAVRRAVATLQSAIEARDASALEAGLAEDFVGNDGLDRRGAKRVAALSLLRNADVRAVLGPLDVSVRDTHATVRCTAAISGGSGGLLPDSGQIYDVVGGWRLDDGAWRLTSLRWTPR